MSTTKFSSRSFNYFSREGEALTISEFTHLLLLRRARNRLLQSAHL
jgi:hypothetical protein